MYAQSSPVLFVNKTSCSIAVLAYCGNCASSASFSESNEVIVAPHSFHLFTDLNTPASGCDGEFAYFKYALFPYDVWEGITFDSSINPSGALCEQNPSCGNITVAFQEFNPIDYPCLLGIARITGEYHNMGSSGSTCHIVIREE